MTRTPGQNLADMVPIERARVLLLRHQRIKREHTAMLEALRELVVWVGEPNGPPQKAIDEARAVLAAIDADEVPA